MQEVFSHSSLSSYENCPRKYAFRYIEKLPADTESIEGFVGKRVHEVLERLYRFVADAQVPSLERVLQRYHANFDESYDADRVRVVRQGTDVSHYRSMGARGLENFYRRHYPFDAETTLGLERPVRLRIDPEGRYRIRGFVDRLARANDGALEIHDYKTSARMPPARILERDRQLALYEMAIRQELGVSGEIRLVWWYVTPNRVFITRRSPEELERVSAEVTSLIDQIRVETAWEPKESPLCSWCEYREVCPLFAEGPVTEKRVALELPTSAKAPEAEPADEQLPLL